MKFNMAKCEMYALIIVHRTLVSFGNLTLILCYENTLLKVEHALIPDKEGF